MKKFPMIGVILLVPALALLVATGCTKDGGGKDKPGPDADKVQPAPEAKKIDAPTEGVVKGVVKFKGEVPAPVKEDAISKHKDKDMCLKGGGKHVLEQTWLVDNNGAVANVVVYLEPDEGKIYDVKSDLKAKWAKNTAVMDQPYCAYVPHAIALYADVQPLLIKNSAKFTHNVKILGGIKNGDTSRPIESGKAFDPQTFKYDRKPIPVACDMHTWMNAKILTFEHPYFAVTKDDGSFEIKDVPVGEELRVMMWHESFEKAKEVQKITVKKGDNPLDLSISK